MRGSVRVVAWDEVGAGVKEETSQGDLEVPAEGHNILEEILAPKSLEKEQQLGAMGGREGGQSRGEKGLRSRKMGGKQQWDPGSS